MNNPLPTVKNLLERGTASLAATSESSRLDAEILLAFSLQEARSHLHAWPEKVPTGEQCEHFSYLLRQRQLGRPVAHLTGEREFWSHSLLVTPDTLIPRPETETLVEFAVAFILEQKASRVLDLGTGSGAIALAVASECPECQITACDNSTSALQVARQNALRLEIENVEFYESRWFDRIPHSEFDLIVSNPPYIAAGDPHLSEGDVAFEPREALISGADGLSDIHQIVQNCRPFLTTRGVLALEHGFDQAAQVRACLSKHGFSGIESLMDLQGHARVSYAHCPI